MTSKPRLAAVSLAHHASPFGPIESEWTDRGLWRLRWGGAQADVTSPIKTKTPKIVSWAQSLDDRLNAFFEFGTTTFENIQVDQSDWTPFVGAVYRHCRRIEPGTTLTYRELAARAGSPRASRAVGGAMARNRIPIVIPCHRVIASSGKLCGFSAPGGLETKQALLDLENPNHSQLHGLAM
ncbi:Methylated-DNA--protein-cysteine methyltransferase [Novipirellula galeiformis]|uniref:methylated-DNA--[protein]-cysteine S-methyltransferase n=1 Tax=Novipirellula galeiformis TaxID=2528004 RepID=A0A5C6CQD9_9BACT|nr:MGMT family protein [Novipirellula galeiformis]TWU25029.1 Methylated-DNA--protein-cysteine methyltransferase [Novipirellula galeiformis]